MFYVFSSSTCALALKPLKPLNHQSHLAQTLNCTPPPPLPPPDQGGRAPGQIQSCHAAPEPQNWLPLFFAKRSLTATNMAHQKRRAEMRALACRQEYGSIISSRIYSQTPRPTCQGPYRERAKCPNELLGWKTGQRRLLVFTTCQFQLGPEPCPTRCRCKICLFLPGRARGGLSGQIYRGPCQKETGSWKPSRNLLMLSETFRSTRASKTQAEQLTPAEP